MIKFNKTVLVTATLLTTLMVSGCDKDKTDTDKKVDTDTATINSETTSNDASSTLKTPTKAAPVENNKDLTVARLTSDTINNQLFIPLIQSNRLTPEQVTCLKGRDKDFAVKEAQAFFESKFTEDELKKLNEFYNSKTGKNLIKYGNEQLLVMNGLEVKDPMPAPSEQELNEMKAFMESPLGKKYQKVNNSEGPGSLVEALQPTVDAELKRCKIDGLQPDPNAPAKK